MDDKENEQGKDESTENIPMCQIENTLITNINADFNRPFHGWSRDTEPRAGLPWVEQDYSKYDLVTPFSLNPLLTVGNKTKLNDNISFKLKKCTITNVLIKKITQIKKRKYSTKDFSSQIQEGKLYSCSKCDWKTKSICNVKRDFDANHGGVSYFCSHCDYKAKHKVSVRNHFEAVHEDFRYSCSQCDYEAVRKQQLKTHIKLVHDEVCFSCSRCNSKATTNSYVKRHFQAVHEGVQYSCYTCDYKAKCDYLKKHIEALQVLSSLL